MRTPRPKSTPQTPKQIAERLYAKHGPMPDHLLRKTATVLRDALRDEADDKKPA